jgi:hypothetical protein
VILHWVGLIVAVDVQKEPVVFSSKGQKVRDEEHKKPDAFVRFA